jgi:hypothetical protein
MRVIANCHDSERFGLLKFGKEYEVLEESELMYFVMNEKNERQPYYKSRFTPIKEDEVMKIKNWKEINGVSSENGNHFNYCKASDQIEVKNDNRDSLIFIDTEFASTEQIVVVLKAFGLEVEFEKEPTITQNDYNWLIAMNLPVITSIIKPDHNHVITVDSFDMPRTYYIFNSLDFKRPYLVSDLLKMKVEVQNENN